MTRKLWVIRAGAGGDRLSDFLSRSEAQLGWNGIGPLDKYRSQAELLEAVRKNWPEYKVGKARITASQLFRFANEIAPGDCVLTYDSSRRVHWFGVVTGPYRYTPESPNSAHVIPVTWNREIDRDALTVATRNKIGSIATLFLVAEDAASEIFAHAKGEIPPILTEEEEGDSDTEESLLEDLQLRSREFIKDKLNQLDWQEMQRVVAGLLRAMNYKTRISPQGADRGKDIIASPDGFGFESPRIVVEVKHREAAMGSPEIRSFIGGKHPGDKLLYVSTSGFTKDAHYEAERASIPTTLVDLDYLVDGLVEHYEKLDIETRTLVPLRKVYWPA